MNRLARERSPYLLQHAANPVEWFPWGDEAFEKAKAEDKPIFLSIGYSTCHWCHVMEHESFENSGVAETLNQHFVSIKVDREERPDVDRVYMTFVQATTGSGGWPMSVWLTPDLKPFYGGTVLSSDLAVGPARLPRDPAGDRACLERGARQGRSLGRVADESAPAGGRATTGASAVPGAEALARTVSQFHQSFDWRHSGFGDAPKFPRPSELLFLLREHARTGDEDARDMVLRTLRAMALGGLRDHVGGGFHRYSVDAEWRVPHFEKMLYDQAQLVLAYLEGAQISGDTFFSNVAQDTLQYVMRQMTDKGGGFYSAEDADSIPPEDSKDSAAHKSEGAFYLWRADELDTLLGPDAELVKGRFGVEPNGNAPSDPQQEFVGKNLLYVAQSVEDLAQRFNRDVEDVVGALNRARIRMFEVQLGRPRPHLDDKVLTAWNGLMIAAFARAARVVPALDNSAGPSPYLGQPSGPPDSSAISFGNRLQRRCSGDSGTAAPKSRGDAEDYAYLIFGLLELFQADGDPAWLEWAVSAPAPAGYVIRGRS